MTAPAHTLPITRWACTPRVRCVFCIRARNARTRAHRNAWAWIAEQRHARWGWVPTPVTGRPAKTDLYTREAAAGAVLAELTSLTPERTDQ